jgi:peptidoglycan/LPS O-acetylase OafA/YrhL
VYGVVRIVVGNHRMSELASQLVVLGLMAASILVAIVIYRFYEQPILRRLKRRFIVPRPRPARPVDHRSSAR